MKDNVLQKIKSLKIEDIAVLIVLLAMAMGFIRSAFIGSLNPLRIVILSIWIIPLYKIIKSKSFELKHIKTKKRLIYLAFWFFYATLSWLWVESMVGYYRHIVFLFVNLSFVFLCVLYLQKEKHFKVISFLWLIALLLNIALSLWEIITANHLTVSRFGDGERIIPTGVFYNENELASFFSLALPFVLMTFASNLRNKIIVKIVLFTILAFTIYGIFVTHSRANYIVIIVIFLLYLFLTVRKKDFLLGIVKGVSLALALVMSIYVIHSVMVPASQVYRSYINEKITFHNKDTKLKQIQQSFQKAPSNEGLGETLTKQMESVVQTKVEGSSNQIRINLIRNGLMFFQESKGLGVGAGNLEYYLEYKAKYNTYGNLNMHNWWIEILVNYGAVVFVGYVVFYLSIIYELFKLRSTPLTKFQAYFRDSLLLSLIGFAFANISAGSVINFYPQWILFGSALAFLSSVYLEKAKEVKEV